VHKDNNNSEQTVGQDSKAKQDALITARIKMPNENNKNTIKNVTLKLYSL